MKKRLKKRQQRLPKRVTKADIAVLPPKVLAKRTAARDEFTYAWQKLVATVSEDRRLTGRVLGSPRPGDPHNDDVDLEKIPEFKAVERALQALQTSGAERPATLRLVKSRMPDLLNAAAEQQMVVEQMTVFNQPGKWSARLQMLRIREPEPDE